VAQGTLSIVEAASMMKVHTQTVRDMIHSGLLRAAQIGRAYVLLEKDVMQFIEAQVVAQTAKRVGGRKK
jgi:excisionase family DNA binding protein